MRLGLFLLGIFLTVPALAETSSVPVRGKLVQQEGKRPALDASEHKHIFLEGDEPTMGVLNDKRLAGEDLEVVGHFKEPNLFVVNPIHTRALFIHKNGRKLMITYWCDVCAIRTYTPGKCWCCQRETKLDFIEPDQP